MKKNLKHIAVFALLLAVGCKQDVLELTTPVVPEDKSCEEATSGSADFTKFIAVGTSWTAGFQAGALFTAGQDASLAAQLNKDFTCVGASETFVQPDINTDLGYNIFVTQTFPTGPILGRFLLQGASPKPTPQVSTLAALPNPTFNPGFLYSGDKTKIQNFSVEAITLGQFLITNTGNWADPTPSHGFSPFYARFASNPGSSKLIGDAATALATNGTFFLFWAGMDDYMLYAANGGDSKLAPLTSAAAFNAQYPIAVGALLGANATAKGVLGNFPDIFLTPHFTSVPYNPVPLDAASVTSLMSAQAFGGYNAALQGLIANAAAFGISDNLKAEIQTRIVTYTASANNTPLIIDQSLTNLSPYFDGLKNAGAISAEQRAGLQPYVQVRQTTSTDILPLSAGSVIGTLVGENPQYINGITVPLADRYVITPVERDSINSARASFNATVAAVASANSDRLALADVATGFSAFAAAGADIKNGVLLTFKINPPAGIFSEDGLHPNSRGYAYLSNIFVDAINAKFGSTVPHTNVALYGATALPIP